MKLFAAVAVVSAQWDMSECESIQGGTASASDCQMWCQMYAMSHQKHGFCDMRGFGTNILDCTIGMVGDQCQKPSLRGLSGGQYSTCDNIMGGTASQGDCREWCNMFAQSQERFGFCEQRGFSKDPIECTLGMVGNQCQSGSGRQLAASDCDSIQGGTESQGTCREWCQMYAQAQARNGFCEQRGFGPNALDCTIGMVGGQCQKPGGRSLSAFSECDSIQAGTKSQADCKEWCQMYAQSQQVFGFCDQRGFGSNAIDCTIGMVGDQCSKGSAGSRSLSVVNDCDQIKAGVNSLDECKTFCSMYAQSPGFCQRKGWNSAVECTIGMAPSACSK